MHSPGKFKRKLIKQIRIALLFFFLEGGGGVRRGERASSLCLK